LLSTIFCEYLVYQYIVYKLYYSGLALYLKEYSLFHDLFSSLDTLRWLDTAMQISMFLVQIQLTPVFVKFMLLRSLSLVMCCDM